MLVVSSRSCGDVCKVGGEGEGVEGRMGGGSEAS